MRNVLLSLLVQLVYFVAPMVAYRFIHYTPEEVTELQKVPLILQGGTDWGGSLVYAGVSAYLFTLLLLVPLVVASLIPLNLSLRESLLEGVPYVLLGAVLFVPIAALFSIPSFDYFDCERSLSTSPLLVLFFCNYIFVCYLSGKVRRRSYLVGIAPLFSLLLLWFSLDGRTFKAGQIRQVVELPSPISRGIRHAVMTFPQRICYLPPFRGSY